MERFVNKTVLVTGASGLIGSNLAKKLLQLGTVNVIALARSEEKLQRCFAEYMSNPNFSYFIQDIVEPLLYSGTEIDFIFHAAGPVEREIIKNKPLAVIAPNLIGTKNCLEFLREQEKQTGVRGRLVLFSSVTVYGNLSKEDYVASEECTAISDCLESPKACYSQSKRMSEVIALAYYRQFQTDTVIARLSTVYGDTAIKPDTAFFEFINKAVLGENINLNHSKLARRDNIYVDDAVSALLCIAKRGEAGQAYNISSNGELGNFASVDEIAQIVVQIANEKYFSQLGHEIKVVYPLEEKKAREPGVRLDNTKLKSLGWGISTSLREGIEKVLERQFNLK